jgi:arginine-tRNA-protein transferase
MSVSFYQSLLDRSWRRSGTLLYRPDQRRSCCPHYTIRLDTRKFKPTKDQRQTVNRFNNYVRGEAYTKEAARLYPKTKEQAKQRDNEFILTERIHEAEDNHLQTPPEPAHKLTVSIERNNFTDEKFEVYSNYQQVVHKDLPFERTRSSFKRFLCDSPLRNEIVVMPDGRKRLLGSYHQCYRLDGKLVAIGVLDLLPDCVSSVYFLYHESIHKFSPGKLGALYEIALAAEEGYRWWYPGFYIHSCPKMRYKLDYLPQEILDPVSAQWDPLDKEVLELLNTKPFFSMSQYRTSQRQQQQEAQAPGTSTKDGPAAEGDQMAKDGEMDDKNGEDDGWMGQSVFQVDMPGITPISEMEKVNMDHIPLLIHGGPFLQTSHLISWDEDTIHTRPSIKSSIAELVAVLGPDLLPSVCLDLKIRVSD